MYETSCDKYKIFRADPNDPILRTHPLQGEHKGKFSVSVNKECRAVYRIEETETERTYVWLWVGHHSDYDDNYK